MVYDRQLEEKDSAYYQKGEEAVVVRYRKTGRNHTDEGRLDRNPSDVAHKVFGCQRPTITSSVCSAGRLSNNPIWQEHTYGTNDGALAKLRNQSPKFTIFSTNHLLSLLLTWGRSDPTVYRNVSY